MKNTLAPHFAEGMLRDNLKMSHLAIALRRLMRLHDLKARDLSRLTGLYDSHIHRLLKGQPFIDKKNLIALTGVFEDPLEKAELVAAHCMDERIGPGSEFVKITIEHGKSKRDAKPAVEVSQKLERALEFLRFAATDDEALERIIVDMAKMKGLK